MHTSWTGFTGVMGTDEASANLTVWQTYADNNWDVGLYKWDTNSDTTFPVLIDKTTKDFAGEGATGILGADETLNNLKKQATYESNTWVFEPWKIVEDLSFPYLFTAPLIPNINYLIIDGEIRNLYLFTLEKGHNVIYGEPENQSISGNYSFPNTRLIMSGKHRDKITLTGYTDEETNEFFITASKNLTKVYPKIHPPTNETDNIAQDMYYYITSYSYSYKKGDDNVYYSMELTFGGNV